MLRTFLRQSLVALAAVALFLPIAAYYGPPAEAWSVTVNNDTCSSPSTSVDGQGNVTITCGGGGGGAPACSITGSGTGTIGAPITLTASCAPAATTYVWGNNGDGAGSTCISTNNTNSCQATGPAASGSVTYTLTASNATGTDAGAPRQKTVTWSNTPSGCTVSPASESVSSGTQLTFTATCSAGSPTSYVWSGPGTAGCNTASCGPITFTATGTINVTPSNASGQGNMASSTITVGGGGGGPISCSNVPGATRVVNWTKGLAAGVGAVQYTQNVGGFGANDALVVEFTASPSLTTQTSLGILTGAEYGDLATVRYGALSASPCDFTGGIAFTCTDRRGRTTTLHSTIAPGTIDPQNNYSVVSPSNCQPVLTPGVVYYWNITNINPATGATGCTTATCNMIININAPGGS